MKWHDGRPVTVEDAVFGFNFWIKHKPPFWSTVDLKNQKSARKLDDETFQVELVRPSASFVGVDLAFCCLIPKHVWEKLPEGVNPWDWDVAGANGVIGSGPFKLRLWRRTVETIMDRHPDHWAAPKIDGLHEVVFSSADALSAALENQDVDVAVSPLEGLALKRLADRNPGFLKFVQEETHQTIQLSLNNAKEPFSDPAFRRALHLATPKEQIVEIALGGFGEVAGPGPVPRPLGAWFNDKLPSTTFNMQEAKKVLAAAGYTVKGGRLYYPTK
jgi:peptide/nickel transport system substrate-binding protein